MVNNNLGVGGCLLLILLLAAIQIFAIPGGFLAGAGLLALFNHFFMVDDPKHAELVAVIFGAIIWLLLNFYIYRRLNKSANTRTASSGGGMQFISDILSIFD